MHTCPRFAECQHREFIGVSIGPKGVQYLCPVHKIPLLEEDMKASDFAASGGGMQISKEGVMGFNNAKLSITGDLKNRGKMSFEDTDIKIDGDLENDGTFSMNEKRTILGIIEALKVDAPNTYAIDKSLAELYNGSKGKRGRWQSIVDYIRKNAKWELSVGLTAGVPHVELKIGSK